MTVPRRLGWPAGHGRCVPGAEWLKGGAARLSVGARVGLLDCAACRATGGDLGRSPSVSLCQTRPARRKGSGLRGDPRHAEALRARTALHDSRAWDADWHPPGAQWN